MIIETERLILRPWILADAESLFGYAKDPDVGPIAGWPPHKNIEESRLIIETVFNGPETYAICLKHDNKPIGAISLMLNGYTDLTDKDDECELGYWIGKPFWGRGYVPEASKALIRRAFLELSMSVVWCAHYEGNEQSKRVQEKCGFKHYKTIENANVPLLNEVRTCHVNFLSKVRTCVK